MCDGHLDASNIQFLDLGRVRVTVHKALKLYALYV